MPIYEYQCDDCGKRSEELQRLADERLTECRDCGGTLRRLISAPSVQFKGTGWYVTDYGGRKGATESASTSESSSSAGKDSSEKDSSEKKGGSEKSEAKADKAGAKKTAGSSPSE
jgi:putative FmdB family regulatory protein